MPVPLSWLVPLSPSWRAPVCVLLLPFAPRVVVVPFVRAIHSRFNLELTSFLFLPARFKRIVNPNPNPNLPAPVGTPQAPNFGMGLGIHSITDAAPGSPLPIPDSLPLEQVGVIDSPKEELQGTPFGALLPDAPDVTVPSMLKAPDLPIKPAVPDTSSLHLPVKLPVPDTSSLPLPVRPAVPTTRSLPLPDDELMKLLADNDDIISAMTQEAMSAASEGEPVNPRLLIDRLDRLKAEYDRIESLTRLAPSPPTDVLPVRRQAPDPISLLSRLKELIESGQLDRLVDVTKHSGTCFPLPPSSWHSCPILGTPPTPDQIAPPNSPLAYAWDVVPTPPVTGPPVAGPPDSTPVDMLDVSAVPVPPPTSPSVVASSVPIAHDDPTMIPSGVLSRLSAAPTPSLDAPFSLENDSGEPFAAAMLAPSWEWSGTASVESPIPAPTSLPIPSLMGARDFKPTAPTGKLSNKDLPPLLAPPKEKRGSKSRFSADR